ncbi:MAG: hypothetical protein K6C95_08850 [Lachnospiraceae bacterium]|nr:hypothetical protein [Lachnospiraceae bacterium]
MISLVVTAVITVLITILKGALSILGFIFGMISRIFRLAACIAPVFVTVIIATAVIIVYKAFTGTDILPAAFFFHPDASPFVASMGSLIFLVKDLRAGSSAVLSAIILVAAVILALPVTVVLLTAHTLVASIPVMPWLIACDGIIYIIYGIISRKSPFLQIRDRYFFLFPKSAKRHYERNYDAWLRRHADEFEDDTYREGGRYNRYDDRYDDGYDDSYVDGYDVRRRSADRYDSRNRYDDRYDDDYDGGYDYGYGSDAGNDSQDGGRRTGRRKSPNSREEKRRRHQQAIDDYYDEDYNIEEETTEDAEYSRRARRNTYRSEEYTHRDRRNAYEDAEYSSRNRRNQQTGRRDDSFRNDRRDSSGFDFFAGCNSLESVEKKYRSLAKIYHPDNQDGDTSAIQEINARYEEARKRFS